MNLLPDLERAVIPLEKLAGYALNDQHPEGKHKARVFRVLLGIEGRHASVLAELIRSTLPKAPARTLETNEFGEKWTTPPPHRGTERPVRNRDGGMDSQKGHRRAYTHIVLH
jgi:hypothetical protein